MQHTATLQKQIKEESGQLEAAQQRLRSLGEKLRSLPRQSELDEATQALAVARAEMTALQEEIESLAAVPAQLQDVEAQLEALGNPREQAAVAQATANRRAAIEENHVRIDQRIAASSTDLEEIESALAVFTN